MRLRLLLVPSLFVIVAGCSSSGPSDLGNDLGADAAAPTVTPEVPSSTDVDGDGNGNGNGDGNGNGNGDGDASVPTNPTDAGTPVVTSGGSCSPGGLYCGGDKVTGDAKTLYKCNGPGTPTVVQVCPTTCSVNSGADDSCAASTPAGRIASPVPGKVVTYPFGVKNSGYAAGYHTGDDYATPTGSDAVAVRSGTIRWSNDNGGAYGKWIGLDADNGRTYVYCHLSNRVVAVGAKIVAGQVLAKTGATGNVTGPHLHFEDHPLGPFVYAQVRKPSW